MNINTSNPVSFAGRLRSEEMPKRRFNAEYDYDTNPILGLGYEGFTYKPTIWQKIKDTITFYSILRNI